jgi:NarL family two-component system response regulator LiaR
VPRVGVTTSIRVVIADDHEIVREGLRTLFRDEVDITVVAEARNGEEALAAVTQHDPDVVLMDLVMPGGGGVEATRRVREVAPRTQVLVLTSFAGDQQVKEALRAGAIGYLLKDVSRDELLRAIRNVRDGRPALHSEAQRHLLRGVTPDSAANALTALTDRERGVLQLIARGRSNKAIAAELFLSEGTVKGYVSVILSKLGVEDRTQAALWAVKHGVISTEQL